MLNYSLVKVVNSTWGGGGGLSKKLFITEASRLTINNLKELHRLFL